MSTSDPRSVRSREAILGAARGLLVERGPAAVTHVHVADRAGVGRATVYRHWPRSEDLLADAMAAGPMPFFAAPTAPVKQWLLAELREIAQQLEHGEVRAVATTLANSSQWDAEMDARRDRFAQTLSDRLSAALTAAQAGGEVTLNVDPSDAAAHAIGPLYYRSTIERGRVSDEMLAATIDAMGRWA